MCIRDSIYRGKRTFSGEEMVEINCHGGVYITQKVLNLCLKKGARMAEHGEFSKRAFLNGRIDLSQAEAISDLITAKNDYATELALKGIQAVSYTHLDVYKRQPLNFEIFHYKYLQFVYQHLINVPEYF